MESKSGLNAVFKKINVGDAFVDAVGTSYSPIYLGIADSDGESLPLAFTINQYDKKEGHFPIYYFFIGCSLKVNLF